MTNNPIDPTQLAETSFSALRQLNYHQALLLVVEDQDDVWTIFQFVLKKCFPDVLLHRTTSRTDTLAFLHQGLTGQGILPKLILQDLYMPDRQAGMSLLEDTRALLSNRQQIPLLVLSSSVDVQDVQQAYQSGCSYYIVKPVGINNWLSLCKSLRSFWWDQGVLPIYSPETTVPQPTVPSA